MMGASVWPLWAVACGWVATGAPAGFVFWAGAVLPGSRLPGAAIGLAGSIGLLMKTVGALVPTVQCGVDPAKGRLAVVAGILPDAVCAAGMFAGVADGFSRSAAAIGCACDVAGRAAVRRLECVADGCEGAAGVGDGLAGAGLLAAG